MRYKALDTIRGLVLISMIFYHACWDLVFIKGVDIPFLSGRGGFFWQQSICWAFILLSGFCAGLGKHTIKRGLVVSAAGVLVMAITCFFTYENRVVFGVLTFLGAAMLLFGMTKRLWQAVPYGVGALFSIGLFAVSYPVNKGYIFSLTGRVALPKSLYEDLFTTFWGFEKPGFFSTDYFSFFPWFFLFLAGFFCFECVRSHGLLIKLEEGGSRPLQWLGRHSLVVYLLHQPILAVFLFS